MSVNARNLRGRDRRNILENIAEIEEILVLLVQETRYDSNFSDREVELGVNRDLNGVYTRFWKLFRGPIPEVLTPVELIECQSLKIAYKIIHDNYPAKKDIFDLATGQRSKEGLSLNCIKIKSKIRKEAFSARIVEDWNKLDPNIKISSTGQFAESSKKYVMDKHRGNMVPFMRERISQRTPYV